MLTIGFGATVAGTVTMIQRLTFPRNTQIHCLKAYPILGAKCIEGCVCVADDLVIEMKKKNKYKHWV